jgi:hypothetical protein
VPALELTPDELARVLGDGELEVVGRMRYSSNGTFLVEARLDGLVVPAVYKPRRGERPLWDFPQGTLCQREVAAHVLSEALGWGLVPLTVLRDGPLGIGAVQRFVDHDPEEHYFTLMPEHEERFRRFAWFDVLANNADRKGGHCLLDRETGTVLGIDHGLTFHPQWKLRTVIWEFAGEMVPDEAAADVERVLGELDDGLPGRRLRDLLGPAEIDALRRRAEALLAEGLPLPEGHSSMPWPLV